MTKISDVLWVAANECLWSGAFFDDWGQAFGTLPPTEEQFSCLAINRAALEFFPARYDARVDLYLSTIQFLRRLGVNSCSVSEFDEFEDTEQRQGARYLWLMFAYQVALDEGL